MKSKKFRHRADKARGHLIRYGRAMGRSMLDSANRWGKEAGCDSSRGDFVIEFVVMVRIGLTEVSGHNVAAGPMLVGMDREFVRYHPHYLELLNARRPDYRDALKNGSDEIDSFSNMADAWGRQIKATIDTVRWGLTTFLDELNTFVELVVPDHVLN